MPTGASIGTAGWAIPRPVADRFPADGSSLERYASLLPAVEINSSFHRPHRLSTWERWRDTTPAGFRFSVKLPRTITHDRKLTDAGDLLDQFLAQAHALGEKLAVLLVQLPPSLAFEAGLAGRFFAALRQRSPAQVACEPRHASWFEAGAGELLSSHAVARVAADPAVCAGASRPGGDTRLAYWRLHGSPSVYRSSYADRIPAIADRIGQAVGAEDVWCIFDNTASSAALADALELMSVLQDAETRSGTLHHQGHGQSHGA